MELSSLIMATWISVILASVTTLLYSVILTVLVFLFQETGMHQMGQVYMVLMFQELSETVGIW